MARKKKQNSNVIGLVILGAIAFGIYQLGIVGNPDRTTRAVPPSVQSASKAPSSSPVPLDTPRFVNVASLNVRHTPSTSGPLIMALPRGTALKVLGQQDGWLLIDINPTLEGWVSESLTTTRAPTERPVPPAPLIGSN